MKRLIAFVALVMFMGCTPAQIVKWTEWYEQDPVAATEFANRPEIQEQLHLDWDSDGVVEPEPVVDPEAEALGIDESPNVSSTSVWDEVAECESGQTWNYNGGSGYDGGLQFAPSTWRVYDGPTDFAWQASREQQIAVAERVLNDVGWKAWPTCSRKLGLR